jgi:hypothetical protein
MVFSHLIISSQTSNKTSTSGRLRFSKFDLNQGKICRAGCSIKMPPVLSGDDYDVAIFEAGTSKFCNKQQAPIAISFGYAGDGH